MLFILEMANNHRGSLLRGKGIINQFHEITKKFPHFKFAFKFQRRDLPTFIHPAYQNKTDIPYIKRFVENQLTIEELKELKEYAFSLGFSTICTPFDELSVQVVKELGFDYIKIGSCSITDWSLLNRIVEMNMPVIGSVGGTSLTDIEKVVSFFKNRQIPLILMYCVGLYPTENEQLGLDKFDILKQKFPNVQIGFSTHEHPYNYSSIQIAIGKGITIFEKHVDIIGGNNEESLLPNEYSILPAEFEKYLESACIAQSICKIDPVVDREEQVKLRSLQRGAFLKRDIFSGEIITKDDLFFAFPIVSIGQLASYSCSKHISFKATTYISKNSPLLLSEVKTIDNSKEIERIKSNIKNILSSHRIVYPSQSPMEISHHYGLEQFNTYGMCLLTLVNMSYCKKLLILQPGQKNPEHYHKEKTETFFVLVGEAVIKLDGIEHTLTPGNIIHVKPNQIHSISANTEVVIEELSSQHYPNDSYYVDETITNNTNRKIIVYV